MNDAQLPEAKG